MWCCWIQHSESRVSQRGNEKNARKYVRDTRSPGEYVGTTYGHEREQGEGAVTHRCNNAQNPRITTQRRTQQHTSHTRVISSATKKSHSEQADGPTGRKLCSRHTRAGSQARCHLATSDETVHRAADTTSTGREKPYSCASPLLVVDPPVHRKSFHPG